MSNLKYWYIDDENGAPEKTTIKRLNHHNVRIELFNLKDNRDFGDLKEKIIELTKKEDFGGLLLDLRLDGNGDYPTSFNATALAQELRSVAGRGETALYPIILTSSISKIKETYNNDKTSHDLFDYKMYKSSDDWEKKSRKLESLANGYKIINSTFQKNSKGKTQSFKKLSGIVEILLHRKITEISNSRLSDRLLELVGQEDKHLIAHFIIKEMFHFTTPLLNKRIMFAKLGLNLDEVLDNEKQKIFEFMNPAKYTGIFSSGWDRWWSQDFEHILEEIFDVRFGLIPAKERVELLNRYLQINLKPAKKLQYTSSDIYSTICEATKCPIDHLEGFKIKTSHDYLPWQTFKYMSLYAIVERKKRNIIEPHISEKLRIKEEKQNLGNL